MATQPVDRMKTKLAMKRRDTLAMVNRSNKRIMTSDRPGLERIAPQPAGKRRKYLVWTGWPYF